MRVLPFAAGLLVAFPLVVWTVAAILWGVTLGHAPWDWLGAQINAQLGSWVPITLPLPPPPAE